MALTNVDLDRIDGNSGLLSNVNTSSINGGPISGARNRIINGDMRIDQRNAGANVTTTGSYPVDRFYIQNSGSSTFTSSRDTTAPAGFVNSLRYTVGTGAAVAAGDQVFIRQIIEGVNGADLDWGTANAKSITISFWVRSSLTGSFGLAVQNYTFARSYVASYTISSANTWEYKTVTISGDTTGTWSTDAANGWLQLIWDLGTGTTASSTAGSWASGNYRGLTGGTKVATTSGATFYITGVQLEAGSVATPFERRSYGQELALCQRYYWKETSASGVWLATGLASGSTNARFCLIFPVPMRPATPTYIINDLAADDQLASPYLISGISSGSNGLTRAYINCTVTGATSGRPLSLLTTTSIGFIAVSNEL
jgi:hypothetical protein